MISPDMAVGKINANTSKRRKEKFPVLREVYWGTDAIWSEGYFVSKVGMEEAVIQRYIEHQDR